MSRFPCIPRPIAKPPAGVGGIHTSPSGHRPGSFVPEPPGASVAVGVDEAAGGVASTADPDAATGVPLVGNALAAASEMG
jgi:hypothetical protein